MSIALSDIVARDDPWHLRLATLQAMSSSDGRPRPDQPVPRDRYGAWLAFAERNLVGPIVSHWVLEQDPEGAEASGAGFRDVHQRSVARMRVLLDELDALAARLSRDGILLVALKNGGIARGLYPCAGCCPMGDIDVLIARDRFLDAHRLALECGFEHGSRSVVEPADLESALTEGGAEYVKETRGETVWLELQWRPVAGRWIRPDQEPSHGDLLGRSVPVAGTDVRLLAPDDNLVQVALHTAKHTYVRAPGLRLHTDVDRLVAFAPPDWEQVVETCRRLTVKTAVFFSLALARALLGTPVPARVLDALSPPGWKSALISRWLKHCDVFEPESRKFNRPGMLLFHALLYDDALGLLASMADAERSSLTIRSAPLHLTRAARRLADVAFRYQP